MLTNFEIDELAKKMRIDCIEGCYFKDELKYEKVKDNKAWIVNLASSDDNNDRTHWCILYNQINDKTKKREWIWFDSYAVIPPTDVMQFTKLKFIPYNSKQLQTMENDACGFWCLAFIYWLTKYEYRTKNLYDDVESFMSMFDDNKESIDIIKNEFLLSQFFLQAPKVEEINKDKIHSIVESSLN